MDWSRDFSSALEMTVGVFSETGHKGQFYEDLMRRKPEIRSTIGYGAGVPRVGVPGCVQDDGLLFDHTGCPSPVMVWMRWRWRCASTRLSHTSTLYTHRARQSAPFLVGIGVEGGVSIHTEERQG